MSSSQLSSLSLLPSYPSLGRKRSGRFSGQLCRCSGLLICELVCVHACVLALLLKLIFFVFVFVFLFYIIIFVKVGVFNSFSGFFLSFILLFKSSCNILPLVYELVLGWPDVFF